jgi:hypothetical protein
VNLAHLFFISEKKLANSPFVPGDGCSETEETKIAGFYDTFVYKEHTNSSPKLRPYWGRIVGGKLMPNYCDGSTDGVVFFASRGPRSLQTLEIDTRNLRFLPIIFKKLISCH